MCGPQKDCSDLDRHVIDCGEHLGGTNKWRQALDKYVEMCGALYPKPDQVLAFRAQAAQLMALLDQGRPFEDVEEVKRWLPSPTAPPEFLFQKRTDLFRSHIKLNCGAVSRSGAVCHGALARFALGMEHLIPLTSVSKCATCKTYTCALEPFAPVVVRVGWWRRSWSPPKVLG